MWNKTNISSYFVRLWVAIQFNSSYLVRFWLFQLDCQGLPFPELVSVVMVAKRLQNVEQDGIFSKQDGIAACRSLATILLLIIYRCPAKLFGGIFLGSISLVHRCGTFMAWRLCASAFQCADLLHWTHQNFDGLPCIKCIGTQAH